MDTNKKEQQNNLIDNLIKNNREEITNSQYATRDDFFSILQKVSKSNESVENNTNNENKK
ncbi:MAG: hypothetical protein WC389_21930 [Lutibacter sp.]|jgi:hypothetical protein